MKLISAILAMFVLFACTPIAPPALSVSSVVPAEVELAAAVPSPACPSDMVEVEGVYCTELETVCLKWRDPNNKGVNGPVQCEKFEQTSTCKGKELPKHYCIDKYEFPNKPGQLPKTYTSFNRTKEDCAEVGKRICQESEWTLACEGPSRKPYPYGYNRESESCNIDRTWVDPITYKVINGRKYSIATPESRLDQRVVSGSKPMCVSDYGVYDMTGNVDEWVVNETGRPYQSGLKGGHWAIGARNRCRPMTVAHNETFTFYETGARCCKDL